MTHGIQPRGKENKREPDGAQQRSRVQTSHPVILDSWDPSLLIQEPAPKRSYPSHQGTYTEQSLRGGKIRFTENDQSPTSNVVSLRLSGFTSGENLTSLKLGGGVSKHAHWNSIKDLQISTSKDYLFAYLSCFSNLPLLESSWPMINLSEAYYYCGILV